MENPREGHPPRTEIGLPHALRSVGLFSTPAQHRGGGGLGLCDLRNYLPTFKRKTPLNIPEHEHSEYRVWNIKAASKG